MAILLSLLLWVLNNFVTPLNTKIIANAEIVCQKSILQQIWSFRCDSVDLRSTSLTVKVLFGSHSLVQITFSTIIRPKHIGWQVIIPLHSN